MRPGFRAYDPFGADDWFSEFGLITRHGATDLDESADGFHTITHSES